MSSLWTDRPAGSDHDWLAPPPPPPLRRFTPPAPPPPPRRRRGRAALVAAAAALVLGGAVVAGTQLDGDSPASEAAGVLPAAGGRPGETRINQIYARASRGVVSVQVTEGSGQSSGTGFVIDADGTIVTNAHVVGSASNVRVRFDDNGRPVTAEVVGRDVSTDLAILRVNPRSAGTLHPLPLADSDDVKVGDAAVAIGYPLGLDKTATAGIVSGLGRQIEAPNGFSIDKVIQTDAPINPGNSGGPLIDARGRVIGVNSQIATAGGGNGSVGIGFAVPSNTVRDVVPKLKSGQAIRRPFLGVSTSPSPDGRGAVVRTVTPGGPASQAGLRPSASPLGTDGDVIVAIDGTAISDPDDVAAAVNGHEVGDEIRVTVRRGRDEVTLTVRLAQRPERAP
ncbi:MAG TPA: trypsin-like peptidase domain-containing protein [Solirubrobacteraceae bacterium]|nr:trypsin-like peptidase domain-containing protein [Solirubrobacteraceae bacterium]